MKSTLPRSGRTGRPTVSSASGRSSRTPVSTVTVDGSSTSTWRSFFHRSTSGGSAASCSRTESSPCTRTWPGKLAPADRDPPRRLDGFPRTRAGGAAGPGPGPGVAMPTVVSGALRPGCRRAGNGERRRSSRRGRETARRASAARSGVRTRHSRRGRDVPNEARPRGRRDPQALRSLRELRSARSAEFSRWLQRSVRRSPVVAHH